MGTVQSARRFIYCISFWTPFSRTQNAAGFWLRNERVLLAGSLLEFGLMKATVLWSGALTRG